MRPKISRETLAVQALGKIDKATGAIVEPIHLTTTFERDTDNGYSRGLVYGRADNQTVRDLEQIVCALEGGEAGLAFGSGMSAAVAIFLALGPGKRIVAPVVMYWALRKWLVQDAPAFGLQVDFVDMNNLDDVSAALDRPADLVWVETPSNPLWRVSDIEAIASLAHRAGAYTVVDSTCATPVLTRPIDLGADMVMHSATKYLNGHSDVIGGMVVTRTQNAFWARIKSIRASHGLLLAPLEAFLLTRGIRTLHIRVRAACRNALCLAERFRGHQSVESVLYPGLPDHPDHALAVRQMKDGFGGMLSIRVRGGESAAIRTAANVHVWKRATSLGGVESLLEHRASVEGAGTPCPPDLLRLSCGIETLDDLYADLDAALRQATTA